MNTRYQIGLPALAIAIALAAPSAVNQATLEYPGTIGEGVDNVQDAASFSEGVQYDNVVHVYKNGELVSKQHNVLMQGEAIMRNQTLSSTQSFAYDVIALGNGTAPQDGDSTLDSEITTSATGLDAQVADTVELIPDTDDNQWNLTATFTSDTMTTVNTTAVTTDDSPPTELEYLAGTAFNRDVNLQPDDQITVEWNFDIQG